MVLHGVIGISMTDDWLQMIGWLEIISSLQTPDQTDTPVFGPLLRCHSDVETETPWQLYVWDVVES